jgi:uncharacterized membrane protein
MMQGQTFTHIHSIDQRIIAVFDVLLVFLALLPSSATPCPSTKSSSS